MSLVLREVYEVHPIPGQCQYDVLNRIMSKSCYFLLLSTRFWVPFSQSEMIIWSSALEVMMLCPSLLGRSKIKSKVSLKVFYRPVVNVCDLFCIVLVELGHPHAEEFKG